MSDVVISVENLYKEYRLGTISHGTLYRDLQSWWARMRGKEDPNSIIGIGHRAKSRGSNAMPHALSSVSDNPHMLALDDVSFEVKRGEVLGIIGRNGAGKSTLLKILSEVTSPTKGTVKIKGRVASLLEVGTGFHPELTGSENIYLNGAILGMTKKEISEKFDEIVSFAEVDRFIDTPVKRYSSGMYVRLAFAVAAHLEPEILIVDEVLAAGDAQFQKKCLGKMGEVSKEGRTVLFVSHNMGAVTQLCTKGLLMNYGQIAFQGDMRDVVNQYITGHTSADNSVDLSTLNHGGHQDFALLKRLSLFNEAMTSCTLFEMGQTIFAHLQVDIKSDMDNVEIGLKISNLMDMAIHYYVSSWEGMRLDLKKGTYTFEIKIPNICLFPGKYLLGAWVLKGGHWPDDNVSGITMIEIISRDVTGNFHALNIKNNFDKYVNSGCEVYAPSSWSLCDQK